MFTKAIPFINRKNLNTNLFSYAMHLGGNTNAFLLFFEIERIQNCSKKKVAETDFCCHRLRKYPRVDVPSKRNACVTEAQA